MLDSKRENDKSNGKVMHVQRRVVHLLKLIFIGYVNPIL